MSLGPAHTTDSEAGSDSPRPVPMADRLATVPGFLPPTVRRWLVERPEAMTTDIDGVLMSADISGFTRLAEKLAHLGGRQASEMLIRTINRCFDPMIDRVADLGGDVLEQGDSIRQVTPGHVDWKFSNNAPDDSAATDTADESATGTIAAPPTATTREAAASGACSKAQDDERDRS